jgi:hypothetical protein
MMTTTDVKELAQMVFARLINSAYKSVDLKQSGEAAVIEQIARESIRAAAVFRTEWQSWLAQHGYGPEPATSGPTTIEEEDDDEAPF